VLDDLLSYPPDEVLAVFQHDLRGIAVEMEAWVEISSMEEAHDKHNLAVEGLRKQIRGLRSALDLASNYLVKRREMGQSDDGDSR
jgi:hypothetical protein